jgi:hypothetical protein
MGFRLRFSVLCALFFCPCLLAAGNAGAGETPPPFFVGEKLTYAIYAAKWKVGYQTIEIDSLREKDGRQVYVLKGVSRSSTLLSIVYRLNDQWTIYMDRDTLLPLRVEKDWQEGRDEGYYIYDIDQENQSVVLQNVKEGKNKNMTAKNTVFDLFSLVYFFRSNHPQFDDGFTFDFPESRGVKTVHFKNEGSMEVRIPQIAVNHTINVRKLQQIGDVGIEIYISDDDLRIPLRILVPSKLPKNRVLEVEFILKEFEPGEGQEVLPDVYRLL